MLNEFSPIKRKSKKVSSDEVIRISAAGETVLIRPGSGGIEIVI
jgi:hypothetical protein